MLGDQHFGNRGTDVGRAFDEQQTILATPGSYVWQCGDSVDSFIVGKLIAENFAPGLAIFEQWALAREYLKNWGDKLLAHVAGNHDQWHYKLTGIDYAREITPSTVLYDSDEIRATIHVGEKRFRILSRHKVRGNSIYNVTHGLERLARFDTADFDIYAAAHVHRGAVAREFTLNEQRKLAVMSGSYKVVDSFARTVGFERHDSSTAVGIVFEDDGTFWATSNIKAVMKYMQRCYEEAA
jgi:predicted phosphodiesterase